MKFLFRLQKQIKMFAERKNIRIFHVVAILTAIIFLYIIIWPVYAYGFFEHWREGDIGGYLRTSFHYDSRWLACLGVGIVCFLPMVTYLQKLHQENSLYLTLPAFDSQKEHLKILTSPMSLLYFVNVFLLLPLCVRGIDRSPKVHDESVQSFINEGPAVLGNLQSAAGDTVYGWHYLREILFKENLMLLLIYLIGILTLLFDVVYFTIFFIRKYKSRHKES